MNAVMEYIYNDIEHRCAITMADQLSDLIRAKFWNQMRSRNNIGQIPVIIIDHMRPDKALIYNGKIIV